MSKMPKLRCRRRYSPLGIRSDLSIHTASTIEKIALGITPIGEDLVSFSLSFISPGSATLELGYRMITRDEGYDEPIPGLGWKYNEDFEHALEAIRTHPLLSNVKRLHIWDRHCFYNPRQLTSMATEAVGLFMRDLWSWFWISTTSGCSSPPSIFLSPKFRRNGAHSPQSRGS